MTMMTEQQSSTGGLRSALRSSGSSAKLHGSNSSPSLTDLARASLTGLAKGGSNHDKKSRRRRGTMTQQLGGSATSLAEAGSSMSFTDLANAGSTHEKKSRRRRGDNNSSSGTALRRPSSSGSLTGLRGSGAFRSSAGSEKNRNSTLQRLNVQPQVVTKTIVCDKDKANRDSILAQIKETTDDASVNSLVVADLLSTREHQALVSSIDALVFSTRPTKNEWQSIKYQDQCNDLDEYVVWMGQKIRMMKDYEELGINERSSKLCGLISWHARIVIPVGTKLEEVMNLFVDIKDDPSVLDMKLNGGLSNPGSLIKRFDWSEQGSSSNDKNSKSHFPLVEPFVIDLHCGWINPELRATFYRKFLNVALCRMKDAQREKTKKPKKQQCSRSKSPVRGGRSKSPKRGKSPARLESRGKSPSRRENRGKSPESRGSPSPARRKSEDVNLDSRRSKSPPARRAKKGSPSGSGDLLRAKSCSGLMGSTRTDSPKRAPTRVTQINDEEDERANRSRSKVIDRMHQRSRDDKDPHSPRSVQKGTSAEQDRATSSSSSSTSKDKTTSSSREGGDKSKYWRSAVDPATGDTYFYNKLTKETSWEKPAEME